MKITRYNVRLILILVGAIASGIYFSFYIGFHLIIFFVVALPGAIAGNFLGVIAEEYIFPPAKQKEKSLDYFMNVLLTLSAEVIKSDNHISVKEIEYVRRFFVNQFGEAKTGQYILQLQELLKEKQDLQKICTESRTRMTMAYRLQILHYLFGVAYADGEVSDKESAVIYDISIHLAIPAADFRAIRAMYVRSERRTTYNSSFSQRYDYYTILEIQSNASNEEVKKAYREMAKKFHPDKLTHLGADVQKAANEKFQKINLAYEKIKKERNIN
jgi:DnaJ like chaperone protein